MSETAADTAALPAKKTPKALTTLLAVLVLGAVGWAAWRVVGPTPAFDRSLYQPIGTGNRPPRVRPAGPPAVEGTITRRADGADVRIPGVRARFAKSAKSDTKSDAWTVDAFLLANQLPPDARAAARARDIALSRPAAAAEAKVTSDQFDKLKALPRDPAGLLGLSDADKSALADLFARHEAAPDADKPAALKALADRLRTAATAARPAAITAARQSADGVTKVLSPQQVQTLSTR